MGCNVSVRNHNDPVIVCLQLRVENVDRHDRTFTLLVVLNDIIPDTERLEYDSDLKKVKDTLYQVVTENQYYDKTKEVDVFVDSFGDSSIKMGVRCMVATENYWKAKWEIQEAIKYAFDAQGIEIPFDQMEVTLKNKDV